MKVLANELRTVWDKNNTLFICGNGGSGANAMHIANDLHYGIGDMLNHKKIGIKVDALTSNTAVITCLANDLGYENIFSKQIEDKASKLLRKKKKAWTVKLKPVVKKQMKAAYRERMSASNPEL